MTPDQLFSICNSVAMVSWIVLIISSFRKTGTTHLLTVVILLLALVYSWLIFSNITPQGFSDFGSLDGISKLFSDKSLLLAGWVHYLAFDLLTGIFIATNARKYNINSWLLLPVLFSTFMLGPFGLLLYFILRLIKTKKLILGIF